MPIPGLSAFLRDQRRAVGLTQRELARSAGVGVGVVRDLEQGVTRSPRPVSVARIAAALGVDSVRVAQAAAAGDRSALAIPFPSVVPAPRAPAAAGAAAAAPAARGGGLIGTVRLGVLGPLAAWRGDAPLALGPVRQRAVLAVLAVRPNTVVHRDLISQALWGDAQPASAVTMIQSYVSQLRRALSGGQRPAAPLVSAGSGYQLRIDDDDLDLLVFARLLRTARNLAADGAAADALTWYEQALTLWRGEPLADIDLLRGDPAVEGLARDWAAAVVDYAEAAASLGEYTQAMPHLQALADREPLNERAHACLMLALAGTGQQAAAIEEYERLRRRLDDELGVRPGHELAQAHLRVLHGVLPGPAAARGLAPASPGPAMRPVYQLPAATADFTGRGDQISLLTRLLQADGGAVGLPVVAISGLPGTGKTALALQTAHNVRAAYPDGQLWLRLDGASRQPRDPADLLGELLRALGVHGLAIPERGEERAAAFRSLLADRRILIVADDAASSDQVRPLLPGTAGSAVIVTSRTQLSDLEGARMLPLDPLPQAEAIRLLARITGAERVTAEPEAASMLVRSCGGLPLAVRIAGARLAARPSWPLALLTERLNTQHRRLDELQVTGLSVRASLTLSYLALDEQSQRAYRLLGLLGPADITEWAVAALLGIPDATEVVNDLANCSLLTPAGTDLTGEPRYQLHDLLRDYAVERLAEDEPPAERAAADEREIDAWLQLAAAADSGLPREPFFPPPDRTGVRSVLPAATVARLTQDSLAWFTVERANLLAAIEHACATGRRRSAFRIAAFVASYQHLQYRLDDSERAWSAILRSARSTGDIAVAAHAELRLTRIRCGYGAHAAAMPVVRECVTVLTGLANYRDLSSALYWLAVCELNLGRYKQAKEAAASAVAFAERIGDQQATALGLRALGIAQGNMRKLQPEGVASCERAIAIARKLREPVIELEVMHSLAHVCCLAGHYQRALELSQQGVAGSREALGPTGPPDWLGLLGDSLLGLGRYEEGARAFAEALPFFQDHFMRRFEALALLKLSYAHQALGNYAKATTFVQESLPIFRELRLEHYLERAVAVIADCQRQENSAWLDPPAAPAGGGAPG